EVVACRPWLEAEVDRIGPELVVALGATAAQAILGPAFRVTRDHGQVLASDLGPALATIHPSAILRAGENRDELMAQLVADLKAAAVHLD
ncbi:MAG: uracil-DNA glycosylase, partial [Chloroflexi bacterium]|nr:uracil-DNA glycosylase [Chloroflexota bacterium]